MLDLLPLTRELCYQLTIKQFGNYSKFQFQQPVNIFEYIQAAASPSASASASTSPSHRRDNNKIIDKSDDISAFCNKLTRSLLSHKEMLAEYFMIDIQQSVNVDSSADDCDDNGTPCADIQLCSLPSLLQGVCTPLPELLPHFLYQLGCCSISTGSSSTNDGSTDDGVDATSNIVLPMWEDDEKACFVSITECIASYYADSLLGPSSNGRVMSNSSLSWSAGSSSSLQVKNMTTNVVNIILPALRQYYFPRATTSMMNTAISACGSGAGGADFGAGLGQLSSKRSTGSSSHMSIANTAVELTSLEQLYKIFERC